MQRLEVDGDTVAWKATRERLDREEAEAQAVGIPRLTSGEIAESLADLQSLFTDAEPATKHRIVQALFEQNGGAGSKRGLALPELLVDWLGLDH